MLYKHFTKFVIRYSGYHYGITSFDKTWTQVLRRFKYCSRRVGYSRWWGSLIMVPAGNKAKRPSWVNHTTKIINHHHHICAGAPCLINSSLKTCNKKRLWYRCFPVTIMKFLETSFLGINLREVASVFLFKLFSNRSFYLMLFRFLRSSHRRCLIKMCSSSF